MAQSENKQRWLFPRWTNYILPLGALMVVGGLLYVTVLVGYGFSAKATAVGYAPQQPIPYSHALHVGRLGMDCRYCHNTVEKTAFAALPATQTCMNCHSSIYTKNPKLEPLRESWKTGKPVEWVHIHNLANYVYFNHSAHVNHGVSCVECHGRVDEMDVVHQVKPLSMSWCIDCHRAPESHLRPKNEVTNLAWKPQMNPGETLEQAKLRVGTELKKEYGIRNATYMTSCYTCHR